MSGINLIRRLESLREKCCELGFKIVASKHYTRDHHDVVALIPRDDELPIYSRDAELWVGTLEDLEIWIRGFEWARDYDRMLKACDAKRRASKEELYRQYRLLQILKNRGENPK